MVEKYRKQFSNNMLPRRREEAARWIRAVRSYNLPEDDSFLHRIGIGVFTSIGRTNDRVHAQELNGKLTVLERQRHRIEHRNTI